MHINKKFCFVLLTSEEVLQHYSVSYLLGSNENGCNDTLSYNMTPNDQLIKS